MGDQEHVDRRGFLQCMAWVGTGAVWSLAGGVLNASPLGDSAPWRGLAASGLTFVQISDSHIGFDKAANPDVTATLREAVGKIAALPNRPAFVLHTGDLTHLSKPQEFDTLQQVLSDLSLPVFYVPGEHDMLVDEGRSYLERFGKGTSGAGWHSFDKAGVHFIGLVNVVNLKAGGLGTLGAEQLAWLADDVRHLKSSTPIVVFAHIPLWSIYPEWGWGTDDSAEALALLKRFGSVSVLNGHIHQVMQKIEGHVVFHTAMSTAFPQPAPGTVPSPGPMKVESNRLRKVLGLAQVSFHEIDHPIAVTDLPLEASTAEISAPAEVEITIDNFRFDPSARTVPAGATVTWTNRDDLPHTVTSTDGRFKSPALDTDGRFSRRFDEKGRFPYYCSIHPKMTARIDVA